MTNNEGYHKERKQGLNSMKEKRKLGMGSFWRSLFSPSSSTTNNSASNNDSNNNIEVSGSSSSAAKSQRSDAVGGVVDLENPNGQIPRTPCLKEFSFADLKSATSNFKPEALLGEGDYGRVYKGWIDERTLAPSEWGTGMAVAIKILYPESSEAFEQWQTEMNILGRRYHPNLIELLGYCWEEDIKLVLVYEFMPKGSLKDHLFNRFEPLSWDLRLKIAIGTARGLAFLHTLDKEVLYRDFKPSTILLDANYNPKLSDFGLAKLGPCGDKTHVTTKFIATNGYAAPEYFSLGHLHVKSDVYSFGVVLLQLLTGLKVIDPERPKEQENLVHWLKPMLLQKGILEAMMDVCIEGQCSSEAAWHAAQLTQKCLELNPKDRPSMKEVLEVLEQIQAIKATPENQANRSFSTASSSHFTQGPMSIWDLETKSQESVK